jgi:hypothetical protein
VKAAVAALLVGAAVVATVVVAALGGFSSGPRAPAPTAALAVQTSLVPRTIAFGDPTVAEVSVAFDPRVVASRSIRVEPSLGAFVQTAAAVVRRTHAGNTATTVYRFPLQCVTDGCVPRGRSLALALPPVVVTAAAGSRRLVSRRRWPTLVVASRLGKQATASVPAFRRASLPPVAYGAPPVLADLLTAAAGVLAAAAAVLAGLELGAFLRRRRGTRVPRTPLAVAVAYVRQAAARPDPADRRKALALLARTLAGEGESARAAAAGEVAWAEEVPSGDRTLAALRDAVPEAQ